MLDQSGRHAEERSRSAASKLVQSSALAKVPGRRGHCKRDVESIIRERVGVEDRA